VIAALVGPTASGKTALALALAQRLPIEIVSCDSQAVVRGMDVGTAKPTAAERAAIPHHLLDVVDPGEDFSAAAYVEQADRAIASIHGRGRLPLVVGGTGLYLRSLLEGIVDAPPKDEATRRSLEERADRHGNDALHRELAQVDPEAAARIAPGDRLRIVRALEVHTLTGRSITSFHRDHAPTPRYDALVLGLTPPRDELYRRVNLRAAQMLEAGLLEETRHLAALPGARPRLEACIGYREALAHLEGALGRDEALEKIRHEPRRYAKRQLTWFRRMDVRWLPWPPDVEIAADWIRQHLASIEEKG
jgi:tRNA dimethylallyltransferase